MTRAKKSLGQHFLTSQKALREIVEAAALTKGETVLEIGPGKGILTGALIKTGAHVVAVEKDTELVTFLQEKFSREICEGKLSLIGGDILEYGTENLSNYKVVANIPYYITGIIIRTFLTADNQPQNMVILIQKEVAERIITRDGKESILSMSVKAYGKPSIVSKVPRRYFSPPPKVDSAILLIENISKDFFKDIDENSFFTLLKQGFSQKRKQLLNTLSIYKDKEELEVIFDNLGIKRTARAENLNVEDWIKLLKIL